jgi:hypothetical protein
MSDSLQVDFSLPIRAYHDKRALGSTNLKGLLASPLAFRGRQDGEAPSRNDSAALALGKLWHDLLDMGPEVFGGRARTVPGELVRADGSMSTGKEAKAWLAELPPDAIPLTPEVSDSLGKMLEQFQANSAAWDIYATRLHQEVSIFWDWNGVEVKCRPDCISEGGVLADWKSTRDERPEQQFGRAVNQFGYGLSAALYEQGCRVSGLAEPPMFFVVSSTTWPHETCVMTLPKECTRYWHDRLVQLLEEYKRRTEANDWAPRHYGEVVEIDLWWPGRNGGSFVDRVE